MAKCRRIVLATQSRRAADSDVAALRGGIAGPANTLSPT
jgi:hypothetical protein